MGEGKFEIDNADITGSIMVRMDAKVDKGSYTDITTKYLLIEKDETAPMISLDDSIVYADAKPENIRSPVLQNPTALFTGSTFGEARWRRRLRMPTRMESFPIRENWS